MLAAEPLRHGQANAATGGIWRVRGPVGTAILKVARRPSAADPPKAFPTSDEPTHWNYWQREALAYQSGLAATAYAGAGITAPDLLQAAPRPDGGVELWLADVGGLGGFDWPVARLARFARELGAAQARWARRVPAISWLSRRWLAQYVAEAPNWVGPVEPAAWDHPNLAPWPEAWPEPAAPAVGGTGPDPGRRRGRRTHPVSSRPLARQPGRRRRDLGPARLGLRRRGRSWRGSRQPDHRRLHRRPDGRRPAARTRRGRR